MGSWVMYLFPHFVWRVENRVELFAWLQSISRAGFIIPGKKKKKKKFDQDLWNLCEVGLKKVDKLPNLYNLDFTPSAS